MKSITLIAASAIFSAFLIAPSSAATTGFGIQSCGKWISYRQDKNWDRVTVQAWMAGYLSGLAAGTEIDALAGQDAESLHLWVDKWCREHPLESVGTAGVELFVELAARKAKSK